MVAMPAAAKDKTCTGRFINPISETCWSCIMPISIGAIPVAAFGQEDIENPPSPICVCPGWPIKFGLSLGFWVPQYVAETTNAPGCLISLGGVDVDLGWSYAARRAGLETGNFVGHARRFHAGALVPESAAELARDLRQLSLSRLLAASTWPT